MEEEVADLRVHLVDACAGGRAFALWQERIQQGRRAAEASKTKSELEEEDQGEPEGNEEQTLRPGGGGHRDTIPRLPRWYDLPLKGRVSMKKIYVGNLPFSATTDEVRELFEAHGEVRSVDLINDRETGRPRGFGFVEMEDEGALAAIEALDGTSLDGRALRINEARPKTNPRGFEQRSRG